MGPLPLVMDQKPYESLIETSYGKTETFEASAARTLSLCVRRLRSPDLSGRNNLNRKPNLSPSVCPWSPREFPDNQNTEKIQQNQACSVLPDFFCVQRCAKRTARPAKLALSGTAVGVKPVGGKSGNSSGDSAAFFGSFLGSKKERLRPFFPSGFCLYMVLIRAQYQMSSRSLYAFSAPSVSWASTRLASTLPSCTPS